MRKASGTFTRHGDCGLWMSDRFLGWRGIDDGIHLFDAKQIGACSPAMFMANSGFIRQGFPMGAG